MACFASDRGSPSANACLGSPKHLPCHCEWIRKRNTCHRESSFRSIRLPAYSIQAATGAVPSHRRQAPKANGNWFLDRQSSIEYVCRRETIAAAIPCPATAPAFFFQSHPCGRGKGLRLREERSHGRPETRLHPVRSGRPTGAVCLLVLARTIAGLSSQPH
jgi:hypothetical protein